MSTKKSQVFTCCSCGNTVVVLEPGNGTLTCCETAMELIAQKAAKENERADGSAEPHVILGIHVADRAHHAPGVQTVLTEHGANIKTRLGLHDVHDGSCSPNGLILIEYIGEDGGCDAMVDRLSAIEGVEVKRMVFDHV